MRCSAIRREKGVFRASVLLRKLRCDPVRRNRFASFSAPAPLPLMPFLVFLFAPRQPRLGGYKFAVGSLAPKKKIRTHRGAPPLVSGSCALDGRSDSGKRGGMYRHAAPSRTARACVLSAGIPKGCPLWGIFGDFLCKQKVTRSGERNTPLFRQRQGLQALQKYIEL